MRRPCPQTVWTLLDILWILLRKNPLWTRIQIWRPQDIKVKVNVFDENFLLSLEVKFFFSYKLCSRCRGSFFNLHSRSHQSNIIKAPQVTAGSACVRVPKGYAMESWLARIADATHTYTHRGRAAKCQLGPYGPLACRCQTFYCPPPIPKLPALSTNHHLHTRVFTHTEICIHTHTHKSHTHTHTYTHIVFILHIM